MENITLVSNEEGVSPFIVACSRGHFVMASLILSEIGPGNFVNQTFEGSHSPLHMAIAFGKNNGKSALHLACEKGDEESVVRLLLHCNAVINAQDNYGWTALHESCLCRHTAIIDILLTYGADEVIRDDDGRTAMDVTLHYRLNSVDSMKYLNFKHLMKTCLINDDIYWPSDFRFYIKYIRQEFYWVYF